MIEKHVAKTFFRYFNRFIVVPAFKSGIGWLISNPITGLIMVLRITGRKTGKIYFTPVNYASIGGKIYCYQGRRLKGQWYLNILANPQIEVLLPHRRFQGYAEEVSNEQERINAMRQILKDGGIAGFVYGFNPYDASDRIIREMIRDIPLVRVTPISRS